MLPVTKEVRILYILSKKGLGYQSKDNKNTAFKNRNMKVKKEKAISFSY